MLTSKQKNFLAVNLGLFLTGLAMTVSGLAISINYHMGHNGLIIATDKLWGLDYYDWSLFHKIVIVLFSLLSLLHIAWHWTWYKNILSKHLLSKNKQVITLSIIFIVVAITGLIPWFIQLAEGSDITRKLFIEIHDKLGLILFIYLILHVVKRFKWFVTMSGKLFR